MSLKSVSYNSPIKNQLEVKYTIWALSLFMIAALLGTSMRLFWVMELPSFEYNNVLHAHSHIAMLGWGFTIIVALFLFFLRDIITRRKTYGWLLLANMIVCIAMSIAFVWNGYTILSISFLTIHLLLAYAIGILLLRDLEKSKNKTAILFGKWAIYWMFLSTLGVWFLPIIIAKVGKLDPLYFASIEFFLHLQFNGWFVYAILAFLSFYVDRITKVFSISEWEFRALQLSLLLTYALPAYWSYPYELLYYLNSLGVLIQVFVIWRVLLRVVRKLGATHPVQHDTAHWLIYLGLISLLVKATIQATLVFPMFLAASTDIHTFFIGFIHLLMLGVFSLTSLGICLQKGLVPNNQLSKVGLGFIAVAFVLTEFVLFGEGFLVFTEIGTLPNYHEILLGVTFFLPLGIGAVLLSYFISPPNVLNKLEEEN